MQIALIDTERPWAFGLRAISAELKRSGHQPRIIILATPHARYTQAELEKVAELVRDCPVIGVSCCSRGSERAHQVLAYFRPRGHFLVWGGVHATLNPEECAGSADVVCIGEGEGMILDLAARIAAGQDWRDVRNAAYVHNGSLVRNPVRPLVANMDDLAIPDFSCSDEYHLEGGALLRVTGSEGFAREELPFIASRGCVFRCTYCCNAKLKKVYEGAGHYVRKHSISEAIRRLSFLRQHHFPHAKYAFFVDDDFLDRTPAELEEFAAAFPAELKIPFECQVSPLRVTPERIEHLVKAGVWRVRMGVESGSERTKKEIFQRAMPNRAVVKASEILSRYPNVVRAYYFIVGNPFEKREDLLETIRLIAALPQPFFVQVFNLIFFPGSVLYDDALAAGFITGKLDSGYDLHYRAGLAYAKHSWKHKNLYLNTLIFLMEGKVTRRRLGIIPRLLLPLLIHRRFVDLNDRHPLFTKMLIRLKTISVKTRSVVGRAIKRVVANPELVYHPTAAAKAHLRRVFARAG